MTEEPLVFPFTRIVGQENMKRALMLNVIDPGIGGVLIKGEKGTAKSTTVRSMNAVLPYRTVVKGCPFRCEFGKEERYCPYCRDRVSKGEKLEPAESRMRVIDLPLSATEDRVSGTLDLEHVLKTGEKKFEPGVLASANGNILYVDEVNLLDDHLVDLLLDSAAMGTNYVEREGVSFSHPAKFVLVGTMNPEEGDLRPQLLDRFGLSLDIKGERDVKKRAEVVKRRVRYDSDPESYIKECKEELDETCRRLTEARKILPEVIAGDDVVDMVVSVMIHFGVDGHRADITLLKAAKANAALEGRKKVTKDDIRATAELVLAHRLKRRPFEEAGLDQEELEKCLQDL
ncbi:ATP-binding protein [Methanomethylophilus alvi]|uniref:ATP-binding protein n=1 Tax=Methanomethylophilus alvi TaxID=1291540 RepID=UPI0037DD3896